jgi:hypothetical protein
MKIGFFGDSFSAEKTKLGIDYKTYIILLEKEYKTNITIKSKGGCSHWDIIINQFLPSIDDLPDICIFTWPDECRFFHRTVRHIQQREALVYSQEKYKMFNPSYDFGFYRKQWRAAEMFYKHLFDEEKNNLEYISSLYYFDNEIINKIKNKKFIHLWSLFKKYEWKNTIALDEPLIVTAENYIDDYHQIGVEPASNKNYLSPNHLPTQELNNMVFEKVRDLINKIS